MRGTNSLVRRTTIRTAAVIVAALVLTASSGCIATGLMWSHLGYAAVGIQEANARLSDDGSSEEPSEEYYELDVAYANDTVQRVRISADLRSARVVELCEGPATRSHSFAAVQGALAPLGVYLEDQVLTFVRYTKEERSIRCPRADRLKDPALVYFVIATPATMAFDLILSLIFVL